MTAADETPAQPTKGERLLAEMGIPLPPQVDWVSCGRPDPHPMHAPGPAGTGCPGVHAQPDAAPAPGDAERLAALFHATYEDLAPSHGYETRKASAKPWADVPEPNRSLMIAVAGRVLAEWPEFAHDQIRAGWRAAERAGMAMLAARAQERIEALRQAAEATARAVTVEGERDEARRQADVLKRQLDDRDADVRTAEGERDEARAEADGGEWTTRYYGDAGQADRNVSWSTMSRPAHTHQRHVWVGPVEPATDDGRAT